MIAKQFLIWRSKKKNTRKCTNFNKTKWENNKNEKEIYFTIKWKWTKVKW